MIDPGLVDSISAFRDNVTAAKPLATLTPLQLASLVTRGNELVAALDAWISYTGRPLDAPDPVGHPVVMIADVRTRLTAARDVSTLMELRGLLGRAVLNLAQGVA